MKNFEKYENELKKYDAEELCSKLIKPIILKKDSCPSDNCAMCCRLLMLWMGEEYKPEPPKVDWNKVPVDTPILVKDYEDEEWKKMHFAERIIDTIYVWEDGKTSWTAKNTCSCNYAKLIETKKRCKEPETDWSKVEVDTPILVREYEHENWVRRYFAKYEGGKVYVWNNGRTSWTEKFMTPWKFAKLAESEEE